MLRARDTDIWTGSVRAFDSTACLLLRQGCCFEPKFMASILVAGHLGNKAACFDKHPRLDDYNFGNAGSLTDISWYIVGKRAGLGSPVSALMKPSPSISTTALRLRLVRDLGVYLLGRLGYS